MIEDYIITVPFIKSKFTYCNIKYYNNHVYKIIKLYRHILYIDIYYIHILYIYINNGNRYFY